MSTTSTTTWDNIIDRVPDGFYQTNTATKAEGWPADTNDWFHLISQTHDNGQNYYALQIAGQFFDNDHFYVRKTAGEGNRPWRELVHSGNRGHLNVTDFGARVDGAVDDAGAFNRARAAARAGDIIDVPAGHLAISAVPTAGPSTPVLWRLSGTKGQGPDEWINMGTDTLETTLSGRKFFGVFQTRADDGPVVRVDQNMTHAGTTVGATTSALKVNQTVSYNGAEQNNWGWAISVEQFNYATTGQHVGIASRTVRRPDALDDGHGPRAVQWALYLEAYDDTNRPSNVAGPWVIGEIDMMCSGDDPGNIRIGYHMNFSKPKENYTRARIGHGILMATQDMQWPGPAGDVNQRSYLGVAYGIQDLGFDVAVFDASRAFSLNGAPALKLAETHKISFDAGNAHQLRYETGGLRYTVGSAEVFNVLDDGTVNAVGVGRFPRLSLNGLPSSPNGLAAGDVWVDVLAGNVLRIV